MPPNVPTSYLLAPTDTWLARLTFGAPLSAASELSWLSASVLCSAVRWMTGMAAAEESVAVGGGTLWLLGRIAFCFGADIFPVLPEAISDAPERELGIEWSRSWVVAVALAG